MMNHAVPLKIARCINEPSSRVGIAREAETPRDLETQSLQSPRQKERSAHLQCRRQTSTPICVIPTTAIPVKRSPDSVDDHRQNVFPKIVKSPDRAVNSGRRHAIPRAEEARPPALQLPLRRAPLFDEIYRKVRPHDSEIARIGHVVLPGFQSASTPNNRCSRITT
jgi:hypothetical protein